MTYLITFTCYGARLHGDPRGSVSRTHNVPGTRLIEPNPILENLQTAAMRDSSCHLSPTHREVVLAATIDTCTRRIWTLMAAHIRPTHLHLVISADCKPEQIMGIIKAHATRCLDESDGARRPRWSRHGSTRYLWNQTQISAACRYVLDGQGDRLTVYPAQVSLCPQQPLTNHETR